MQCDKARRLMAAQVEGELARRTQDEIRSHLISCTACAEFARNMRATFCALQADAEMCRAEAGLTTAFGDELHLKLLRERDAQKNRPIVMAARWMGRFLCGRTAARALVTAGIAAVMLALAYLGCVSLPDQYPQTAGSQYGTSHLAYFDVRKAADGRVYASLVEHSVPGRCYQKRNLQ